MPRLHLEVGGGAFSSSYSTKARGRLVALELGIIGRERNGAPIIRLEALEKLLPQAVEAETEHKSIVQRVAALEGAAREEGFL